MTPPRLTVPVSRLPAGTNFARYCQIVGTSKWFDQEQARAARLLDSPLVGHALALRQKMGIGPIFSETFTSALTESGLAAEVLDLLRGRSIFDAAALGLMRRGLFLRTIPVEASAPAGGWVPEGQSTPLTFGDYTTTRLTPHKLQTAIIVTRELLEVGNPASEGILTNALIGALAALQDDQLLNPSVTASVSNPASLTSGGTAVPSTGTTAAQMTADLNSLLAAITTSGKALRWVLRPTTAARIAVTVGAAAADLPRTLCSLPVMLSSTSPQQVALIDFGEVTFNESGIDVDRAEHASLEMSDAPSNAALSPGSPSDDPVPTQLVSLWQSNLVALRVSRFLDWQVVRTGAVSYMQTSY